MGLDLQEAVRVRMAEAGEGRKSALSYVRSRDYVARGLLPTDSRDPDSIALADAAFDYEPKSISPESRDAFLARLKWKEKP